MPCSQGQAALFGKEPQEIPPARARAARRVRGGFVVEGTGKAEPRSSRRAQEKHRAGDRGKAGGKLGGMARRNFPREGNGIEDAQEETASGNTVASHHSATKQSGECTPSSVSHRFRIPPSKNQEWRWRGRRRATASERRQTGKKSSAQVGVRRSFSFSLAGRKCCSIEESVDCRDALADPTHDGNRHTITQRPIARAVGCRFAAILNERVVVGKSLQAFALAWGQPANGHALIDRRGRTVFLAGRRSRP